MPRLIARVHGGSDRQMNCWINDKVSFGKGVSAECPEKGRKHIFQKGSITGEFE
ncbi:MAG: hypothetical protein HFI70_00415 [Lachnospiraceae bacterium]|nr:hypothetical protein [Lachnospiraceae bacterium]